MDVQGGQLGAGRWLKDVSFFDEPGDQEHQVHMEGYQVSNQCQALVRDGCLVPTKDAPELGYVRQSTNDVYVPDVYYKVSPTLGLSVPLRSSLLFLFFFNHCRLQFFGLARCASAKCFTGSLDSFFFKWLSTYYVSRWPPATHQVTSLLFTEFLLNFRVRVTEFSGPLSLVGFFFLEEGGRVGFQPTGCFRVPTIDTCSPSFHRFLLLRPITLVTRVLFFFACFHISHFRFLCS